ncbi:MAG: hypothetical protein ACYDGT_01060, partial [Thermoleophilia bacterium]
QTTCTLLRASLVLHCPHSLEFKYIEIYKQKARSTKEESGDAPRGILAKALQPEIFPCSMLHNFFLGKRPESGTVCPLPGDTVS